MLSPEPEARRLDHKSVPLSWHHPFPPCPPATRTVFLRTVVATVSNPAPQASEPPPTLTNVDAAYLQALFALDRDLFALAEHAKQPLEDVFAWAAQPRIQAAIELIARLQADGIKAAALALLRELAETTDDLVERRRALNQLFRALNPPQYRRPSADPRTSERATDRCPERSVLPLSPPTRNGTATATERPPSPRNERLPAPTEDPAADLNDPFEPRPTAPQSAPAHTPNTQSALEALADAEHLHAEALSRFGPCLDAALDAEEDELEDRELDEEDDDPEDDEEGDPTIPDSS